MKLAGEKCTRIGAWSRKTIIPKDTGGLATSARGTEGEYESSGENTCMGALMMGKGNPSILQLPAIAFRRTMDGRCAFPKSLVRGDRGFFGTHHSRYVPRATALAACTAWP